MHLPSFIFYQCCRQQTQALTAYPFKWFGFSATDACVHPTQLLRKFLRFNGLWNKEMESEKSVKRHRFIQFEKVLCDEQLNLCGSKFNCVHALAVDKYTLCGQQYAALSTFQLHRIRVFISFREMHNHRVSKYPSDWNECVVLICYISCHFSLFLKELVASSLFFRSAIVLVKCSIFDLNLITGFPFSFLIPVFTAFGSWTHCK